VGHFRFIAQLIARNGAMTTRTGAFATLDASDSVQNEQSRHLFCFAIGKSFSDMGRE
jgi:hypothetical protein